MNDRVTYAFKWMSSPLGRLKLVASDNGLAAVLWEADKPTRVRLPRMREEPGNPILREAEKQLGEYFSGNRRKFTLKFDCGGTPFQQLVWKSMLAIPYGETRTYGELAAELGKPSAARAVGAAIGRNPISIIGPCHRVVGSTGKLTGFAGGLEHKATLLRLEAGPAGARRRR